MANGEWCRGPCCPVWGGQRCPTPSSPACSPPLWHPELCRCLDCSNISGATPDCKACLDPLCESCSTPSTCTECMTFVPGSDPRAPRGVFTTAGTRDCCAAVRVAGTGVAGQAMCQPESTSIPADGKCRENPPGCGETNPDSSCESCEERYRLADNTCERCAGLGLVQLQQLCLLWSPAPAHAAPLPPLQVQGPKLRQLRERCRAMHGLRPPLLTRRHPLLPA